MNNVFLSSASLNFKPFPQSGSGEIQDAKKIIFKREMVMQTSAAHRQPGVHF
jgi:hypothetical protein